MGAWLSQGQAEFTQYYQVKWDKLQYYWSVKYRSQWARRDMRSITLSEYTITLSKITSQENSVRHIALNNWTNKHKSHL